MLLFIKGRPFHDKVTVFLMYSCAVFAHGVVHCADDTGTLGEFSFHILFHHLRNYVGDCVMFYQLDLTEFYY